MSTHQFYSGGPRPQPKSANNEQDIKLILSVMHCYYNRLSFKNASKTQPTPAPLSKKKSIPRKPIGSDPHIPDEKPSPGRK